MTVSTKPEVIVRKTADILGLAQLKFELKNGVAQAIQVLRDNRSTVGFAESCTGGLASNSLAQVPGVSDVFMGSLVTYANYVKVDVLGVDDQILERFGAVSPECAKEMSEKALMLLKVSYAVAITGIAGPGGGSKEKPVGTVFISVSGINSAAGASAEISTVVFQHDFGGLKKREDIQWASAVMAFKNLQEFVNEKAK